MNKKLIIIFSVVSLIALIAISVLAHKNISKEKKISVLESEVSELEDKLKKEKEEISGLEDKVSELEDNLSDVKHFDDDGSIGQGFSSERFGSISFTGIVLKTQIDGDFEGWEGETIFKMVDGSIWQQSSYEYIYHYAFMPNVIIYKNGGEYHMRVEDVDDEIAVRQIK